MMSILQKIRLGAAIVLLCAICLPLSQCAFDGGGTDTPQALAHARHLFPRSDDDFGYYYGIEYLQAAFVSPKDYGVNGALTLIAFVWPLGFAVWSRKSKLRRFWWIFYTGELVLCAGTGYSVCGLALGTRWLYGFYVAEAAIAIYACTTLILILCRLRSFFAGRKAQATIEA
jgi:hypothetical protein